MSNLTPFKKILIANRAEIALRVIRTAKRMGFATVAIYSDIDVSAQHVLAADEAYCIGGAEPSDSYLNIENIIAAALAVGADAIHPGYGFLAENSEFAQACIKAGLVFIGPSATVMSAMGDKAHAKQIMRAAGVPCVPGYDGDNQEAQFLLQQAEAISYPIMIKAVAGGGGRGMRVVNSASEFADTLTLAKSESRSAFGDDRVILERAIQNPRHIEIQILSDRYGNAVHLGERDCSIQRRHQKIIEEAPAPFLSAELRSRMGATAVKAVQEIKYEGAGTLEFLLDTNTGDYYFMEMNTRLQVEHPITEAITGVDLVEQQINIAFGKPLELTQKDIQLTGHAIEVRLCAEDTANNFMPQSGEVLYWQEPELARVESAVSTGSEISPYYDSMFAKIITCGKDRDEARLKMEYALENTIIFGLATNRAFLKHCIKNKNWVAGGSSTSFIGDNLADLLPNRGVPLPVMAIAAVLRCYKPAVEYRLPRTIPVKVTLNSKQLDQALVAQLTWDRSNEYLVDVEGSSFTINILGIHGCRVRLALEDKEYVLPYLLAGDKVFLRWEENDYLLFDENAMLAADTATAESSGFIKAPSSCKVVAVKAKIGDKVIKGQLLLTTEAMKMEQQYVAPFDGIVKDIAVMAGQSADAEQLLVSIEAIA